LLTANYFFVAGCYLQGDKKSKTKKQPSPATTPARVRIRPWKSSCDRERNGGTRYSLYKLMKSGIEITGCFNMSKEVAMFCDEAGIGAILKAATEHCPQAVMELETGIRRFRNSKT
jgi:hypothetical protein